MRYPFLIELIFITFFFIATNINNARAGDEKTFISEFVCGDLTMIVSTVIVEKYNHYKDQTATIEYKGIKNPFVLDANKGKKEYIYGEQDFGVLRAYKCFRGYEGKNYLVLYLSLGGNCLDCEWFDIIATDGKRIVSSNGGSKAWKHFISKCKELGLPQDWHSIEWEWLNK